jgi:hypothetical protein
MKKKILILAFCCSAIFCHGQEILSPKVKAKYLTGFPFRQFSGGVITIRATLNDIPDTLNFILDTGCGGISLDSTTCAQLGITATPSDTTITGMGGSHKVSFAFDQTLHLPGLAVKGLDFHINNYDLLSSVYGTKIDGIIGYSFLSRYIVKVDFDSLWIEVYTPGEIKYPREGALLHPFINSLPTLSLQIKDARKINFNFYFDMGAALCFLMNEDFANDSSILLSHHTRFVTKAEGLGGRLQMEETVIKQVEVGGYKFKSVPTFIYNDEFNVTSYPNTGGLIGDDLLRRFNMIINYPNFEIHLLPNKHFNDSFDYAYTGMAIYFIDGKIIVDDVIPGSPAEKAGILKDDILVAVGDNTSNDITQYKNLLETIGDEIRLLINRNGTLYQFTIKPISIK